MKITCENCGAVYDIPDWIGEKWLEILGVRRLLQCDKCDEVDEWVQDHRVSVRAYARKF